MKTKRFWTFGHRPFVMGGSVDYVLACDLECTGPHKLGKGQFGFLATAPNGKTFVCEGVTGAMVGDSLESVRADIKRAKPAMIRAQIKDAKTIVKEARARGNFEVKDAAFFWKQLRCEKP